MQRSPSFVDGDTQSIPKYEMDTRMFLVMPDHQGKRSREARTASSISICPVQDVANFDTGASRYNPVRPRSFFLPLIILAALFLSLGACTSSADLRQVEKEKAKAVKRYDVVQALVGNGEVVVGGSQAGAVLVAAEGGGEWRRIALAGASLTGLAACPDGGMIGIDFNHKVWSADRQGQAWQSAELDKPRVPLAITCDSQGRWWVAGSGAKIAVSADRGAHWPVTDLQEDAQFTTIQFTDDRHGIVLGEFGHVVVTDDAGASWHKLSQIPGEFYPYAALFLDRNEGFASGIAGQILRTVDGGRTWTRMDNTSGAALYRLFLHEGQVHGVGAGGVIARLEQGQWRSVPYPDAVPAFLGSAASVAGGIVIGGPGGLRRVPLAADKSSIKQGAGA